MPPVCGTVQQNGPISRSPATKPHFNNVPLAVKITHVGGQSKAMSRKLESGIEMVPLQGVQVHVLTTWVGALRLDFLSVKHVPQILCGIPQNTTVCPAENFFGWQV